MLNTVRAVSRLVAARGLARRAGTMPVLQTVAELRAFRAKMGGSVGFVPTMGALHQGHLSLCDKAASECKDVVRTRR